MRFLAIDIGGTKTAAALIDDDGVLELATWTSPQDAHTALDKIAATCAPLAREASACGVSFGGPFDFANQTCVRSMHVPGWNGVGISRILSDQLDLPVITDNDANVAALGEFEQAPVGERNPLLYVTISTGVGAAIVTGDHTPDLLRGAHSLAGELGHLPVGHDKSCNCGQVGCLERAVSGYWIERDHGEPASVYLSDPHHYETWITNLIRGLWSAVVLVDPAVVVLGGGMTTQGDRLIDSLRSAIAALATTSNRTLPPVRLGDAAGRTVLSGAAILAKGAFGGSR